MIFEDYCLRHLGLGEIGDKLNAIPDMRQALREANEDELIEVFDALDVTATYTKPTRRLELAATVTPKLVRTTKKTTAPGGGR